jgi:hypothetical protein
MKNLILLLSIFVLLTPLSASAQKIKNPIIRAKVVDATGNPVKGAYIFVYDSPDTRRAVDLVSPVTDENGFCEKAIPPGSYWILARLKSNAKFDMGPLKIEDKFSGDPLELEAIQGEVYDLNFTVVDLLDTIKTKSKKRKDLTKVTGKVINAKGEAMVGVFAYANRNQSPLSMPDYFSAWTESDGKYILYLPKGKYSIGAAAVMSHKKRYKATQEITVDNELNGVDIVLK